MVEKVSHVSREELEAARSASTFSRPQNSSNRNPLNTKSKKYFVDELTDLDIINFFSRYGYLSHQRGFIDEVGSCINVDCEDMIIMFSDFTVDCEPIRNRSAEGIFNYDEFEAMCKMIGSEPRIVVADSIFLELLGSLPYYVEKKEDFDANNREKVYRKAPENYKNILKKPLVVQAAKDSAPQTIKQYGGATPQDILSTASRYNSYESN